MVMQRSHVWDIDSLAENQTVRRRVVHHQSLKAAIDMLKVTLKKPCDADTRNDLAKVGIILSNLMVK